jgi:glucosamine-6-phosphate deaminase
MSIAPTLPERVPVVIHADAEHLAIAVAARIAALIRARQAEGRTTVLGLATGATPIGVYRELVRLHREAGLSFRDVTTFNLDEYLPMDPASRHSYHRFMREHLFDHVDLDPARAHVPRGDLPAGDVAAHCAAYEAAIRAAGGIDLQLLGIGRTGHLGFNEPGSPRTSRTRVVRLDRITRADASSEFFGEAHVPREAVTMGLATILEARSLLLLATGEHKAGIVRRAVEGAPDPALPATLVQEHPDATWVLDAAAAAGLTRIATPWLLGEPDWDEATTLRAVTWLSGQTGKAILKLTPADYSDHHLGGLLSRHDSAGEVNGLVWNLLIAKIRGRSKLPRGARIVVFSPHPDDDVISMGGILRKLVLNDNVITVAYQTSGNIAVFDHDVRRYVDVLERLVTAGALPDAARALAGEARAALRDKVPGEPDTALVQRLKQVIREAEAVSGIETLGLQASDARFLDLPFYRTGAVRKDPVGPADVAIVQGLLDELRPDLVFAAGDLSDPHGTHRLCLDAVRQALAGHRAVTGNAPDLWLYRGAWQEWDVTEATWLVPLSQEELALKIQAIFKHQSQKDSAPFPGGHDPREFWQRVEARNTGTAALLDRLGLAEYHAVEAYVVEPGRPD